MADRTDLEKYAVYEVDARNFQYAIYAGGNEMVGVRVKWGDSYLFTEYTDGWYATVTDVGKRLGQIPEKLRSNVAELGTGSTEEQALLEWMIEWFADLRAV